jgi:hypothetical protein
MLQASHFGGEDLGHESSPLHTGVQMRMWGTGLEGMKLQLSWKFSVVPSSPVEALPVGVGG